METKKCSKCGRELPRSEFHSHSSTKDGLQSQCKECAREAARIANRKRRCIKKNQSGGAEVKAPIATPVEKPMHKVYTNPVLAPISPRELMMELKARGYEGELVFKEIKITEHRINLSRLQ
jgi:hypothetical protein